MSKWISGKELLERSKIKDFELFNDYVRKGLQPYDDLGQPVSPLDVMKQILDVNALRDELAEHERFTHQILDESEAQLRADRTIALGDEIDYAEKAFTDSEGVSWTECELPSKSHLAKAVLARLSECIFRRGDVNEFQDEFIPKIASDEKAHSKKTPAPKKLRPNQRHKISCRAEAEKLWKEDPSITIADMIHRDELNKVCEGRLYTEKVMRKWINDLCPDRSRGRRSGQKSG